MMDEQGVGIMAAAALTADPFAVNEHKAIDALGIVWNMIYRITFRDGLYRARRGSVELTASTPDGLVREMRTDWGLA
jgi:hypothetical protein